ncbi:hypothetical protein PVAP13_5NG064481 [Panicum virgatum]|uniref:Uncharacterized protein n=1 Tax=Panicum virgatum TaxID=38727 RepID=A0A8T0RP34_PANVG|nr:hypothetical protein PVAP13_5NG064481 [Panicum virgatum]
MTTREHDTAKVFFPDRLTQTTGHRFRFTGPVGPVDADEWAQSAGAKVTVRASRSNPTWKFCCATFPRMDTGYDSDTGTSARHSVPSNQHERVLRPERHVPAAAAAAEPQRLVRDPPLLLRPPAHIVAHLQQLLRRLRPGQVDPPPQLRHQRPQQRGVQERQRRAGVHDDGGAVGRDRPPGHRHGLEHDGVVRLHLPGHQRRRRGAGPRHDGPGPEVECGRRVGGVGRHQAVGEPAPERRRGPELRHEGEGAAAEPDEPVRAEIAGHVRRAPEVDVGHGNLARAAAAARRS